LSNLKLLHRYSGIYGLSNIQVELPKLIQCSEIIKLNDVSSQFNLPIGETRTFIYSLIHKGLLKVDLREDDLSNNPTIWAL